MSSSSAIKLIVGLGNPGPNYQLTRHNAGAWFVDALATADNISLKPQTKFHGCCGELFLDNQKIILFLPSTYMNESGRAVQAIAKFYNIAATSILIAHDDLDLPVGTIKLKRDGGHGGHNGLRDIIKALGTTNFPRLRVGIGHPGQRDLVHDYVLSRPSKTDLNNILDSITDAIRNLPAITAGDFEKAMQALHTR